MIGVDASRNWFVNVDHAGPASGSFERAVPLTVGQSFTILLRRVHTRGLQRYYVHCLPTDFPLYSFERGRAVEPRNFIVTTTFRDGDHARYVMIFNRQGVPMWWYEGRTRQSDAKLLADGTLAWHQNEAYEIHRLDGRLVRTVRTVGERTDGHDLQQLPGGNYLVGAYVQRDGVDLTPYGGPPGISVLDAQLQEVTPDGNLVWSWSSRGHIGLEETERWWPRLLSEGPPYDIVHWNSIEATGDLLVVSMRHTDAIYAIDRDSGDVVWKLGGTRTPEQLTVLGDPDGDYPFGGQHDARLLDDGTLTIHDNKTDQPPPPRAIRYRLDPGAGTATLIESIADPDVPSSACCGGARRLPSGDWLTSWGRNPIVAGYAPGGRRTFSLRFDEDLFSYRAFPVPAEQLSWKRLRNGMNAMHPRP